MSGPQSNVVVGEGTLEVEKVFLGTLRSTAQDLVEDPAWWRVEAAWLARRLHPKEVVGVSPGASRLWRAPRGLRRCQTSEQVLDGEPAAAGHGGGGAGDRLPRGRRRVRVRRRGGGHVDHGGRPPERQIPEERDDQVLDGDEAERDPETRGPGGVVAVGEARVPPEDAHARADEPGARAELRDEAVLEGRREAAPEDDAEALRAADPDLGVEDEERAARRRERHAHLPGGRGEGVRVRRAVGREDERADTDRVAGAAARVEGGPRLGPLGRGEGPVGTGLAASLTLLDAVHLLANLADLTERLEGVLVGDLHAPLDGREARLESREAPVELADVGGGDAVGTAAEACALLGRDACVLALLLARAVGQGLEDEVGDRPRAGHGAAVTTTHADEHVARGARTRNGDAAADDGRRAHLAERRGRGRGAQDVEVDGVARGGRPHELHVLSVHAEAAGAAEALELVGLGGRQAAGGVPHAAPEGVEQALARTCGGGGGRVLSERRRPDHQLDEEHENEREQSHGRLFLPRKLSGISVKRLCVRSGGTERDGKITDLLGPYPQRGSPLPPWHRSSSRLVGIASARRKMLERSRNDLNTHVFAIERTDNSIINIQKRQAPDTYRRLALFLPYISL